MQRISGLKLEDAQPKVAEALKEQRDRWGVLLDPYLLYARRPSIFHAVQGMWAGLGESGLLRESLVPLVCRRVASLNECPF